MKSISLRLTNLLKQFACLSILKNAVFSTKRFKYVYLLCSLFMSVNFLFAQKDEKFTIQDAKDHCAALPLEKRARVSVTRFNVTTSTPDDAKNSQNAAANNTLKAISGLIGKGGDAPKADKIPPMLGDNLATGLTNALHQVNCYRVLESLDNNKDLTKEIDAGDNKYARKNATPKAGKQLGAQIVVTGEVTEYSEGSKGKNIMGVGTSKKVIKMGFTLKMINPETRDLIVSKEFRVQTESGHSVSVMGFYSSSDKDPAVAAVMDDGILQAVQYLVKWRDSLNITADGKFAGNGNSDGTNDIEVDLNNANYTSYNEFSNIIASMKCYKSMEKTLSGGVGTYTVTYANGNHSKFVDELSKKMGSKYEITTDDGVKIEVKVK